jgi:hypothetical protein
LGDIGDKAAVDALTLLLVDDDASVKSAAKDALVKLNAKAVPMTRSAAAPAGGESKPVQAAEPLARAPAAKDATVEFKSKQGFSFEYPASWAVATKEQTRGVGKVLKTVAPNLKHVDLNRIDVLVYNAASQEFAESLNVVVTRGAIPINEETRNKYAGMVTDGYRQAGASLFDVKTSVAHVAGTNALTIRFLAAWPRVQRIVIRHWQTSVPGKRKTFIVTCSARDGDWTRLEPVFERMVNSLRIEPDTAPSWDALPGYAKGMIIGAVIGGLIGLLIKLFGGVFRS